MGTELFKEFEVIASYSRAQAIEDGMLVDLMQPGMGELVREAGLRMPIAMTIGAYAATIQDPGVELPPCQDVNGRLWDVLQVLRYAIRKMPEGEDRVWFQVMVWNGEQSEEIRLWSICGPGDNLEPVITIMLEGED